MIRAPLPRPRLPSASKKAQRFVRLPPSLRRGFSAPRLPRAGARRALSTARRQVHFASRLHLWTPCLRRKRTSRACSKATTCCAPERPAEALGASIERLAPGRWRVRGPGLGALLGPRDTLDFGNAGTGSRLMMGVVGSHRITARFDGDASLRKRPMRPHPRSAAADGGRSPRRRPRAGAVRSCSRARATPRRSSIARLCLLRRSSRRCCWRASMRAG